MDYHGSVSWRWSHGLRLAVQKNVSTISDPIVIGKLREAIRKMALRTGESSPNCRDFKRLGRQLAFASP